MCVVLHDVYSDKLCTAGIVQPSVTSRAFIVTITMILIPNNDNVNKLQNATKLRQNACS